MEERNSMIKRIKHYFALRKARKRFILLSQMIDAIDRAFTKKNIPRWQRRQFWNDFINAPETRAKFMKDMGNGL